MKARENEYSKIYPDVPVWMRLSEHEIPSQTVHHGKSLIEDVHEEIVAKIKTGKSLQDLSREYGFNAGTIASYFHRKGIRNIYRRPSLADPYKEQIIGWLHEGRTYAYICERIGLNVSTLSGYIKRNGLRDGV